MLNLKKEAFNVIVALITLLVTRAVGRWFAPDADLVSAVVRLVIAAVARRSGR